MKYLVLTLLFIFSAQNVAAQENISTQVATDTLYKPNYPDGVYLTKEDFINKRSDKRLIWPINIVGLNNKVQPTGIQNCYFYGTDREKITDVFAVSHKGHLYFQLNSIVKNCNRHDKNLSSDLGNSFTRVIIGGDHYFYTEAQLGNVWAKGLAIGGIGGAVGNMVARSQIHGMGIVWDLNKHEFNIFKDCMDFNEFISWFDIDGKLDCKIKNQNPYLIRQTIDKVK